MLPSSLKDCGSTVQHRTQQSSTSQHRPEHGTAQYSDLECSEVRTHRHGDGVVKHQWSTRQRCERLSSNSHDATSAADAAIECCISSTAVGLVVAVLVRSPYAIDSMVQITAAAAAAATAVAAAPTPLRPDHSVHLFSLLQGPVR